MRDRNRCHSRPAQKSSARRPAVEGRRAPHGRRRRRRAGDVGRAGLRADRGRRDDALVGGPGVACQHREHERHQDGGEGAEHDPVARAVGRRPRLDGLGPPAGQAARHPVRLRGRARQRLGAAPLVREDVEGEVGHHRGRAHRERQRRQAREPPELPPGGGPVDLLLAGRHPAAGHPAGHVRQHRRQQERPERPHPAAGGQAAPRVRLAMTPGGVRGPVEAGDAVAGDAGGRRVAEQRLGLVPAHAVHADLGESAELDRCGHQPG